MGDCGALLSDRSSTPNHSVRCSLPVGICMKIMQAKCYQVVGCRHRDKKTGMASMQQSQLSSSSTFAHSTCKSRSCIMGGTMIAAHVVMVAAYFGVNLQQLGHP